MKKFAYFLPLFIVVAVLNGCTPLPTGGPVSTNVIYKTYSVTIVRSVTNFTSSSIDINNDGVNDLTLENNFIPGSSGEAIHITLAPAAGVEIAMNPPRTPADTMGYYPVKAFILNDPVNAASIWSDTTQEILKDIFLQGIPSSQVKLAADYTAILGIRINNGVAVHYAWLRIFVKWPNALDGNTSVSLIESAYNKNDNEQILAGRK